MMLPSEETAQAKLFVSSLQALCGFQFRIGSIFPQAAGSPEAAYLRIGGELISQKPAPQERSWFHEGPLSDARRLLRFTLICDHKAFNNSELTAVPWLTIFVSTQASGKASLVGEPNILRIAPTATRFAYLPISMPSPATAQSHNYTSAATQISKEQTTVKLPKSSGDMALNKIVTFTCPS